MYNFKIIKTLELSKNIRDFAQENFKMVYEYFKKNMRNITETDICQILEVTTLYFIHYALVCLTMYSPFSLTSPSCTRIRARVNKDKCSLNIN